MMSLYEDKKNKKHNKTKQQKTLNKTKTKQNATFSVNHFEASGQYKDWHTYQHQDMTQLKPKVNALLGLQKYLI